MIQHWIGERIGEPSHRALPQAGAQPGPRCRPPRADQETAGEAPKPVHRQRDAAGIATVAPLQEPQRRVLQPAAGRQHRKPGGFVDHMKVAVVVDHRPGGRNGALDPGGAVPGQAISHRQRLVLTQYRSVALNLTGSQTGPPDASIGMAMACGIEGADLQTDQSRRHPLAIDPALVGSFR